MLDKKLTRDAVCIKCIEYLEEYAKNDAVFKNKLETNSQTTRDFEWYINEEARKALNGKNGGFEDATVYGWAIHFVDENIARSGDKNQMVETNEEFIDGNADDEDAEEMVAKVKPFATPKPVLKPKAVKPKPITKPEPIKKAKQDNYAGASLFDF